MRMVRSCVLCWPFSGAQAPFAMESLFIMSVRIVSRLVAAALLFVATPSFANQREAVVDHYADLAEAMYADALSAARDLQAAIGVFVAAPSADAMDAARSAWVSARVPYLQTEVYRFGNPVVDDWEGKVNAWPLDE